MTIELLNEEMLKSGKNTIGHEEIEKVRGKCIFTTHTPMAAGHDQFPLDFVQKAFGSDEYLVDMQDMYAVDVQKHIL